MAAFLSRDWEAFIAHWTKILADQTIMKQTILYKGQVAGNIISFTVSGERDVGYWIGKEFWGMGIATRALEQFLGLFRTRPLYAHVAKHNLASLRVLEKCGFIITGEDRWSPIEGGAEVEDFILKLNAMDSGEASG